ncbi:MAG TPA: Holliday junction resolvase RuvX [Candidatus Fimenecus excrementavium]|nr:Holliday junction resolvase RuvX [Candidatus Fimenecus excrementavium]
MVILSVDYGDARTGIAACDALQMLASPVTVIHQSEKEPLADEICRIAAEKKAQKLVLGLPKNMDGSEGFRAQACREFAALLSEKSGLPVDFQDERLTTVSAHNALNLTNTRGKKRKAVVDAVSAVIILEDYLRRTK